MPTVVRDHAAIGLRAGVDDLQDDAAFILPARADAHADNLEKLDFNPETDPTRRVLPRSATQLGTQRRCATSGSARRSRRGGLAVSRDTPARLLAHGESRRARCRGMRCTTTGGTLGGWRAARVRARELQ